MLDRYFITQNNGAKFELDVNALDVYFNLTYAITQLMNKIVPWKGARERDLESMQISIKALISPSYVVLDGCLRIYMMVYDIYSKCAVVFYVEFLPVCAN